MNETATLDLEAHYKVNGYPGIAWYVVRHEYAEGDAEQYEWSGIHELDPERVVCVMVGDDRRFTFDVDELTQIGDEDFCRGCGQIGCGCEVWS